MPRTMERIRGADWLGGGALAAEVEPDGGVGRELVVALPSVHRLSARHGPHRRASAPRGTRCCDRSAAVAVELGDSWIVT